MRLIKSLVLAAIVMLTGAIEALSAVEVDDVINDSITHYNIAIASYVATNQNQVSTATLAGGATTFQNLLENRKSISIQNLSTSANIFCRVSLSSTSANGDLSLSPPEGLSTTVGTKAGPGGLLTFNLKARNQAGRVFVPFCVNDSGSGSSTLEVIQTRSK